MTTFLHQDTAMVYYFEFLTRPYGYEFPPQNLKQFESALQLFQQNQQLIRSPKIVTHSSATYRPNRSMLNSRTSTPTPLGAYNPSALSTDQLLLLDKLSKDEIKDLFNIAKSKVIATRNPLSASLISLPVSQSTPASELPRIVVLDCSQTSLSHLSSSQPSQLRYSSEQASTSSIRSSSQMQKLPIALVRLLCRCQMREGFEVLRTCFEDLKKKSKALQKIQIFRQIIQKKQAWATLKKNVELKKKREMTETLQRLIFQKRTENKKAGFKTIRTASRQIINKNLKGRQAVIQEYGYFRNTFPKHRDSSEKYSRTHLEGFGIKRQEYVDRSHSKYKYIDTGVIRPVCREEILTERSGRSRERSYLQSDHSHRRSRSKKIVMVPVLIDDIPEDENTHCCCASGSCSKQLRRSRCRENNVLRFRINNNQEEQMDFSSPYFVTEQYKSRHFRERLEPRSHNLARNCSSSYDRKIDGRNFEKKLKQLEYLQEKQKIKRQYQEKLAILERNLR